MTVQQARVPVLDGTGRFPDAYASPSVAANTAAAQEARTGAETAQGKAETARQGAEDARDAAHGSAIDASGSATTATTAAATATTMAGQTVELQDAAVAGLIATPGTATATRLSATYARAYRLDVTRYGVLADGVTDDTAAINAAHDVARDLIAGGHSSAVQLIFPPGRMRVTGRLGSVVNGSREPITGVSWVGCGVGVTVFAPEGYGYSMIHRGRWNPIDPMYDITFQDFEIDGSGYTLTPDGQYNPEFTKGIFMQDVIRGVWRNLYIHDCGATGLGVDFLPDHLIENVIAERNGRLWQADGGHSGLVGASGIGIGTGRYEYEPGVIAHCIARDNANHGIFWERQGAATSAYWSKGYKAVACHASGNRENFSDRGVDGLELVAITSANARERGVRNEYGRNFHLRSGSSVGDKLGLELDAQDGDSTVDSFEVMNAVDWGVLFYWGDETGAPHWIRVRNLMVSGSGDGGINTNKASSAPTAYLEMSNVTVKNNGQKADTEYAYGIRLFPTFEELWIDGVRAYDDQPTKTQWRGIASNPAALWKKGAIRNSDLTGNSDTTVNTLTKISAANISPGFEISRVRGYSEKITPTTGQPTSSPWTRNVGPERQAISFYGATSATFAVNGQQITRTGATEGTFIAEPGDVVTATFTGTGPTIVTRYV